MASGLRPLTPREVTLIGKFSKQHGSVLGLDQPIADSAGGIGSPLIRLSVLDRLLRRNAITQREAAAGEVFHRLFQRAHLDGLRAGDMARVPVAIGTVPGDITPSHERCRVRIAEAVAALGGNGSVAASAVWHCVGLEWPIRKWAATTRRAPERSCGILIGALAVLAAHFARAGRRG